MRHHSRAVVLTVLAAALACGLDPIQGSTSPASSSAPPVILRDVSQELDCHTNDTIPGVSELLHARMQTAELTASFDLMYLSVLTKPVLADPTATSWTITGEHSRYEASSILRGNDWGLIEAGVSQEVESPWSGTYNVSVTGTIRYVPAQLFAEITGAGPGGWKTYEVLATDTAVRVGSWGRACESGLLLDLIPWVLDGQDLPRSIVCRRADPEITTPIHPESCRFAAVRAFGESAVVDLPVITL